MTVKVISVTRVNEKVKRIHLLYTVKGVEKPWAFDWNTSTSISKLKAKARKKYFELKAEIDAEVEELTQFKAELED